MHKKLKSRKEKIIYFFYQLRRNLFPCQTLNENVIHWKYTFLTIFLFATEQKNVLFSSLFVRTFHSQKTFTRKAVRKKTSLVKCLLLI